MRSVLFGNGLHKNHTADSILLFDAEFELSLYTSTSVQALFRAAQTTLQGRGATACRVPLINSPLFVYFPSSCLCIFTARCPLDGAVEWMRRRTELDNSMDFRNVHEMMNFSVCPPRYQIEPEPTFLRN